MKEATLRDFFLGTGSIAGLAAEARDAVESRSPAVLAGELPAPALEAIAFAVVVSEHLRWAEGDELVARVLYDWASPGITWALTGENVLMFRDWLTGDVRPPSEPEVTSDTLSGWGRWTTKVQVEP